MKDDIIKNVGNVLLILFILHKYYKLKSEVHMMLLFQVKNTPNHLQIS